MGWFTKKPANPVLNPVSLYRVLREMVGIMSSTRAEVRATRKQLEEIKMNIESLSANIQRLIDAANAQKSRAQLASAAADRADQQPQIDELNSKVVAAIEMINGMEPVTVQVNPSGVVTGTAAIAEDPNAPVT
jgi:predicted  nucleic acid-binding Zn-ribbon protein